MKRLTYTLFIFILSILGAYSQQIDSLLKVLDKCIEQKDDYRAVRLHCIDSLRLNIGRSDADRYDDYSKLYQSFSHLQADSALHYLDLMGELETVKGDKQLSTLNQLNRAEQLAVMGAYSEASNIVEDLSTADMIPSVRTRYFHVCRTIYGWTAQYLAKVPGASKEMLDKTQNYRDSIMMYEKDKVSRDVVHADYLIAEGHPGKAKEILVKLLKDAKDKNLAYTYYTLSEAYRNLDDKDNELRYLIVAAIEDLKRGVTEYAALPDLVCALKDRGDISRAYNYMLCAMEDANYCNAMLRSLEISEIYPIIEKEHNQRDLKEMKMYKFFFGGLTVLAILLLIAIFYLRKEAKKLKVTKAKLADANEQLEGANKQLIETNTNLHQMDKVKEEYIAMFISKCRKYIKSLESYRKSLLKLAKSNQQAELMKTLKDDTLIEKEEESFYKDFDEAFLDIHPNFVERFNALLNDDSQIVLKKGELLNAELRIFALIRLGITDTTQIAEFLNYSMPTIYNYRSRIRNKAKIGKDEFEEKVKEL